MPSSQYLQIDIKSAHNAGKIPGVIQNLIEKDVEFSIPPTSMYHYAETLSSPGFSVCTNVRDSTSADSAFSPNQSAASFNQTRPIDEEGNVPNQEMHRTVPHPTNSLIPTGGHGLVDPNLPSAFNFGMLPPPVINMNDPRTLNMLLSGVSNNGMTVDTSRNVTNSSNPLGETSGGMARRDSIDTLGFPIRQQLSSGLVPPNFCGQIGVTGNATGQNQVPNFRPTASQFCLLKRNRASSVRSTKYAPFTAAQKEQLNMLFAIEHYPTKATKEQIAAQFNVSYQKVDRYFSKQRSKLSQQK